MIRIFTKTVAIIVAHPDDETLWAGGTILDHPHWKCFIISLCRGSDAERASKFYNALEVLKAEGVMGDLNDGPKQNPLNKKEVEDALLELLPPLSFDLIITHNPNGEYTRHLRHEEVSKAVIELWQAGKIVTKELRTFAYEDCNKAYHPRPVNKATFHQALSERIWNTKYDIITKTYGFTEESWEAQTTPRAEAFWQFNNAQGAMKWIDECSNSSQNSIT